MELSDYRGVLRRWSVLIIAGTLVAALIGYRIALRSREAAHPLYAATASVVVNYVTPPGVPYIPTLSLHTQTDVLSARVQDPGVLSRVAARAHVALSQVQRVSTAVDPQKPLITIQALGTTPRTAAAVAQGLAQYLAGVETQQVQAQVASLSRTAARAMAQAQQRWQEAQTHYYLVCNCIAGQHQAKPHTPPTAHRTARSPSTRPAPQPSRQSRQQISRRPSPPLTRQPRHQVSRQPLRSPSRRPAPRRTSQPSRSRSRRPAPRLSRQPLRPPAAAQQTATATAHQTATAVASGSAANSHHRSSPGGQRRGAPVSHRGHRQQFNRRPAPRRTSQPRHQVSRQPPRSRSRRPAPRLSRQPLRPPAAAQQTATATAHQTATAVAQQTASAAAQQTATAVAQQTVAAAAQQAAIAAAQQMATAVALQTASAAAQQTATAVAQQTAAAAAQQTATAAAQQMATAVAQQTATAAAQHTATAVAQHTAIAAAHQTATAVAEQTAAADQQTAIAAAQQTAAADQQTATAVAEQTAAADQQTAIAAAEQTAIAAAEQTASAAAEQTATVEPDDPYIRTLSPHIQTDVLSARVQDPGVLSRVAARVHVALSQVQRVSTALDPQKLLITIQALGTTPQAVAVVAQRPAQYLARVETQQVQAQVASLSRTAASAVAQAQQRRREAQMHYYLVCNCVAGQHQAQLRTPPAAQRPPQPPSTRPPQQLSKEPADPATLAQLRAELDLLQADYAAAASRYTALRNNPVPVATVLPSSVSAVRAPATSPVKAVLLATVVGFVLSSGLAMLFDYRRKRLPALARAHGPGHVASPLPDPSFAGAKDGSGSARRAHAARRDPEPAATLTRSSARPLKAVLLAAGLGLLACIGLAALLLDRWTMPLSVASHVGARRVRLEERRWPQAAQPAGPLAAPPAPPALLLNPNAVHFNHHDGPTRRTVHTIYVVNVGPAPVTIRTITITGADRAVFAETDTCTRSTVGVYGRCTISVRVAPMAGGGPRKAILVITTNAPGSPQRVPLST